MFQGNVLQHSNLIKTYSQLLRDPACLSSDLLISQSGIFSPFLIKFLEKKATKEIINVIYKHSNAPEIFFDKFLRNFLKYFLGY